MQIQEFIKSMSSDRHLQVYILNEFHFLIKNSTLLSTSTKKSISNTASKHRLLYTSLISAIVFVLKKSLFVVGNTESEEKYKVMN